MKSPEKLNAIAASVEEICKNMIEKYSREDKTHHEYRDYAEANAIILAEAILGYQKILRYVRHELGKNSAYCNHDDFGGEPCSCSTDMGFHVRAVVATIDQKERSILK